MLPARDCPLLSRNLGVFFWPYNKPFICPSLFGQDGWILASFFFLFCVCVFMDLDFVLIHKNANVLCIEVTILLYWFSEKRF